MSALQSLRRHAGALAITLPAALLATPPAAAADRLGTIARNQELRVCIWPDYFGITYRNPKTQQLSGVDIEMARALAAELGVALSFVDSSFARLIDDLGQDRCEVAMFAIGITPTRAEKLRFTQPHLASDIYAIASRANRRIRDWQDIDRPGNVVAVARGTLHEPVMRERLKAAKLLLLDSAHAREQEVEAGRADVFMTDYPYSQRFLQTADWARVVAPPATFHLTSYAWAVMPGDDAWLARLDAFMATVKRDGRLRAAARQHRLEAILAP